MINPRCCKTVALLAVLGACTAGLAGHEVPVHKTLTDLSIDYLLAQRPDLAACGTQEIRLQLKNGVDHEDDFFVSSLGSPDPVPLGRFFFHFLPRLGDTVNNTLTVASGCDSPAWGLDPFPCSVTLSAFADPSRAVTFSGANLFRYQDVLNALTQPPDTIGKSSGVVGLGHLLHLLQDLTSPAHARSDAHPHLPLLSSLNDPSKFEVVNVNFVGPLPLPTEPLRVFVDEKQAFTDLQRFTSEHFFSEKGLLVEPGPKAVLPVTSDGYILDVEGYKIARFDPVTGKPTIDTVVARQQFERLAAVAIRWTASMIRFVHESGRIGPGQQRGPAPVCEQTLDVSFSGGNGFGSVTSSADNVRAIGQDRINCNPFYGGFNCEHSFPSGQLVTLTAVGEKNPIPSPFPGLPNEASPFLGWTGDCAGQGPICTIQMNGVLPKEVNAVFGPATPPGGGSSPEVPPYGTPGPPTTRCTLFGLICGPPVEPLVVGNQIRVVGNWRISYADGDADDFHLAIGADQARELEEGFSRDAYFGSGGVEGVFSFWEDASGFPPPTLLEVVPLGGNRYEVRLDDNADHSKIDLILLLQRLPD